MPLSSIKALELSPPEGWAICFKWIQFPRATFPSTKTLHCLKWIWQNFFYYYLLDQSSCCSRIKVEKIVANFSFQLLRRWKATNFTSGGTQYRERFETLWRQYRNAIRSVVSFWSFNFPIHNFVGPHSSSLAEETQLRNRETLPGNSDVFPAVASRYFSAERSDSQRKYVCVRRLRETTKLAILYWRHSPTIPSLRLARYRTLTGSQMPQTRGRKIHKDAFLFFDFHTRRTWKFDQANKKVVHIHFNRLVVQAYKRCFPEPCTTIFLGHEYCCCSWNFHSFSR